MKLDIYCGLLGSGKTTLIKQMLKTAYVGYKTAIIENEFGSVNLDAEELKEASVTVQEISSGCICCTVKGSFANAMDLLSEENPDYIVIEPSGVANLADVLKECTKSEKVTLNRVIMVVNGRKIKKFLSIVGNFFKEQLHTAHTIYLNFNETMTPAELDSAKKALLTENPKLQLVTVPLDAVDNQTFPEITPVCLHNPEESSSPKRVRNHISQTMCQTSGGHPVMRPVKSGQIESMEYRFSKTFTEESFARFMNLFQQDTCSEIFRVKGYLKMKDNTICKVDQVFGDNFEETIPYFPEEKSNILIIIGKNLPVQWLKNQFRQIENG